MPLREPALRDWRRRQFIPHLGQSTSGETARLWYGTCLLTYLNNVLNNWSFAEVIYNVKVKYVKVCKAGFDVE